jgi:hypothetical protein
MEGAMEGAMEKVIEEPEAARAPEELAPSHDPTTPDAPPRSEYRGECRRTWNWSGST